VSGSHVSRPEATTKRRVAPADSHRVKAGESLWSIAEDLQGRMRLRGQQPPPTAQIVKSLSTLNHITQPSVIHPGEIIRTPVHLR
jgi:hypothetical protein